MKFCKHCNCEHPLTKDYWYRLEGSPRCKVQVKTKVKQYNLEHSEQIAEYQREYRSKHAETRKEQGKAWRKRNIVKHRKAAKQWYYANRSQAIARSTEYTKNRRKVDVSFKLACNLRTRMYSVLQGLHKTGSAIKDLGCTTEELRNYLEQQFTSEMCWENYGTYWEIDHIIPLASFDLEVREQYKTAAHYSNLQPLPVVANRVKRDMVPTDSDVCCVSGKNGERCNANTVLRQTTKEGCPV